VQRRDAAQRRDAHRSLTHGGLEVRRRVGTVLTVVEKERGAEESLGCGGGRSEVGAAFSVVKGRKTRMKTKMNESL